MRDINILVIEDDNDINELLKDILNEEGYKVQSAYSGTEALIYLSNQTFSLILLDLMLPGKSGEEILEEVRKRSSVPIIVISAKEGKEFRINAFKNGADDFIMKPFDVDDVLARVYANLRRALEFSKNKEETSELKYKEIQLNADNREVFVNGVELALTTREFDILKLFIENPRKVFSKGNLFKSIWGENFLCDDNTITVHVSNLRSKISKVGAKEEYIKTVWGIGYKFD
ncbi:response regulator transcription factor [Clostridium sp. B9]|uniref:response regulator transcription factor n=1 Tax=Clostridium sp. B9 TaxID=3423224 RepID=UPI003D2EA6E9